MLDTKRLVVGALIGGIALQLGGYLIFDVAVADFYAANRSPQLLIRETPLRWAAAAGDFFMAALITLGIVIRRADNPTIGAGLLTGGVIAGLAWFSIHFTQYAFRSEENFMLIFVDPLLEAIHGGIAGAVIAAVLARIPKAA
jgi:hypothetical protein